MKRLKSIRRYPPVSIPASLQVLPPLLARIYANRGVQDATACNHALSLLAPPHSLTGIAEAAHLLADVLTRNGRILIVGDFDADGATSSALAVRVLRAMGAAHVDYLVPNRFEYGYGLTPEIVAVAALRSPELIVTVDNGISSVAGVKAARQRGCQVLITDHHLAGRQLPEADAIVNPNLPGDTFPSKNLAGVGVVFYVLAALRRLLEDMGWFAQRGIAPPVLAQSLDLVALGTVADVVALDHNNRVLVEQGLRRIRNGCGVPGIAALLTVGGRDPRRATASDLAFAAGPRLNAAGRMDDMSLGIECLLADDPSRARELALQLDELNRQRRAIEVQMQADALLALDRLEAVDETQVHGLCLYDPGWHIGVVGILASRIKDRLHRPVIAFARDGTGDLRGSARSIQGVHIRDLLDGVATQHPGLLTRFGGHAMAAGVSLPLNHLDEFRTAFDQGAQAAMGSGTFEPVLMSDGELGAQDLNLDTAQLLRLAGPWGQGFSEPLFDGEFQVLSHRIVGERHLKLALRPAAEASPIEAIAFNFDDPIQDLRRVHIAYRLDVSDYGGIASPQLVIERLDGIPTPSPDVRNTPRDSGGA